MCFSVGVGRNALPWFQPSASGKEIVLRPLPRPLPAPSIRGRALPQMRQNGPDRFRVGDICDHPQRAAAQRADRNIDIKYTLEPLCPTRRAAYCLGKRSRKNRRAAVAPRTRTVSRVQAAQCIKHSQSQSGTCPRHLITDYEFG